MRWHFVATKNLEPWDWRTPDRTGIGNSETSQVEMAGRLAQRGHEVTSYGWLPDDCETLDPRGVRWRQLEDATFEEDGIWVLYRCPELIDRFTTLHHGQQVWLMMQDTHYDSATPERAPKLDRVLVLCAGQRQFIAEKFPDIADKLVVSSNGIRTDMIDQVEAENGAEWTACPSCGQPGVHAHAPRHCVRCRWHEDFYYVADGEMSAHQPCGCFDGTGAVRPERATAAPMPRNPHRLHFSSSPDRGLKVLLQKIFPRAKEYVPELELHVYYGWNNIEKLMETDHGKAYFGPNKAETERLLLQPGVVWHGRVGQRELTREFLQAGLWVFPSQYPETSCATCMEAQALGAIPVTSSLWALGENVRHGVRIDGDAYGDALVQARYTAEIVRLCVTPGLQDQIRAAMMDEARRIWDWERFVDQWEALALGRPSVAGTGAVAMMRGDYAWPVAQAWFQGKHAQGRTLVVGCSDHRIQGGPGVAVTNLDLLRINPATHSPTVAEVQADARALPYADCAFETVVLGDIIEHLSDADAVQVLAEAQRVATGRVLVTWPVDARPRAEQSGGADLGDYAPGISTAHPRPVTRAMVGAWCETAGLAVTHEEPLTYPFARGHGLVLEPSREAMLA